MEIAAELLYEFRLSTIVKKFTGLYSLINKVYNKREFKYIAYKIQ
jgi:hypothetical protein